MKPPVAVRERMSRVDTAWLRMDNDVNLMMIVGVWLLRPAVGYEAVCRRIEERLLRYPRFRQAVVREADGAYWCEDERFDIHRHVVREKLKRRRGHRLQVGRAQGSEGARAGRRRHHGYECAAVSVHHVPVRRDPLHLAPSRNAGCLRAEVVAGAGDSGDREGFG